MNYSVISIEDGKASLENEENEIIRIEVTDLPENVKEGDMLHFNGTEYFVDEKETASRRAAVHDKFSRLFKK